MTTDAAYQEETDETPSFPTPEPRTLLDTWSNLLDSIEASQDAKIGPEDALRVLQQHSVLDLQDVPQYHHLYHELLKEYREVLHSVITPEALKNIKDDAEANHDVYVSLIRKWNLLRRNQSRKWSPSDADAAPQLCALVGTAAFIFGEQGILNHLDTIGFKFSDEERAQLTELLSEGGDDE